ncbi:MAG: choice-of-anchor L domain-containing protein [Coleofasciculus sp. G3-WIS-01]|uniref:choice-of-anchor L domain-containing protein n=1 Tax=Coleofasciculus sp. G3-WIS-01 TaxID=3069528 RepID=UPI0033038F46
MGLLPIKTTTITIATTAILSLGGLPAMAFTITPNSNAQDLLNALLGDTAGLSNFGLTVYDDLQRVNDDAFGIFNNDPFGLGEGIVLSTGKVADLPGLNEEDGGVDFHGGDLSDLSTDFEPQSPPPVDPAAGSSPEDRAIGMQGDNMTLELSFDADDSVEKLFFQYVFGSEEFVEFGGTDFNDSFTMWLNGQSLALLSDGQAVTINNLVPDPNDETSYHPDFIYNPVGSGINTKLDGFTKNLTFEGQLIKNSRNTIKINVADWGDGILDSAVFIKGKSLGTKPPQIKPQPTQEPPNEPQFPSDDPGTLFPPDEPEPKSVPEPSGVIGLLGVATVGVLTRLRRKQQTQCQEY